MSYPDCPLWCDSPSTAGQRAIPPMFHKAEEDMSDLITGSTIAGQIGQAKICCPRVAVLTLAVRRGAREDGVRLVRLGPNGQPSGLRKQ